EQFRKTKPDWAPDLPISFDACQQLQSSTSKRMRQLGDFGMSLLMAQWDLAHPEYADYCREVKPGQCWRGDETLEEWERLCWRISDGVDRRGQPPNESDRAARIS